MSCKPENQIFSRRTMLQGLCSTSILLPKISFGQALSLQLHHQRGSQVLSDVLSNDSYWANASKDMYVGQHYDEIRLQPMDAGYLAFVSGEGKQDFEAEDVANTIFAHQNLIPQFMPSLKSACYLESGIDSFNGYPYNDIYFLADLKILHISVALRTYKIQVGAHHFICPIEMITPEMVSSSTWKNYQELYQQQVQKVQPLPFYQTIVEPAFVFGMYVVEPGQVRQSRVTLVTQLAIRSEDSFLAAMASELPFFLKQGMQVGFESSVLACHAYAKEQ